jgi:hypothetical protein
MLLNPVMDKTLKKLNSEMMESPSNLLSAFKMAKNS